MHVASHIPLDLYPYVRYQMAERLAAPSQWMADVLRRRPAILDEVLDRLADGPLVAGDLAERVGPKGTWWDWDDGKLALEHLLRCGLVVARRRRNDFARIYELASERLPAELVDGPAIPEHEARKELLRRAARHHGVGTLADLADYHRQRTAPCKPLIAELVEEGELIAGAGRRVGGSGVPAPRRPPASAGGGPRPAQPVRSVGVVSRPGRAAVRLRVPHRDLHAAGQAGLRLLRAADPARRLARRAGRSEGRSCRWAAAGPGIVGRTRCAARGRGRGAGRGAARDGRLARPARGRGRRSRGSRPGA